jgi:hypothetical protein
MSGFQHLLYPVHLEDLHPEELRQVYHLAKSWGAKLTLIHIHQWMPVMIPDDTLGLGSTFDPAVVIPCPDVSVLKAKLQSECTDLDWETCHLETVQGDWAEVVSDQVQKHQVDVVITHHRPSQGWFEWLWDTNREDWESLKIPVLWLPHK